jgi:hypothetical protein
MGQIEISTDPARLDVGLIHAFLSEESHWARGITRERVERALTNVPTRTVANSAWRASSRITRPSHGWPTCSSCHRSAAAASARC